MIRLKIDFSKAYPLYVYWAINTSNFLNYINQMNSATSVRPNMKIDYLLDYQFLVPPIQIQQRFVNNVEPIRYAISLNNDEMLRLEELKNSLLATMSSR